MFYHLDVTALKLIKLPVSKKNIVSCIGRWPLIISLETHGQIMPGMSDSEQAMLICISASSDLSLSSLLV